MFLKIWAHLSYFLNDFKFFLVLLIVSFVLLIIGVVKVFKSSRSDTFKKFFLTFFFSLFLLIFLFSFFEAFFRYRYDQSDGLGYLDTNQRWLERHVVFNTYGFRDRDFTVAKKHGVIRIGVLGDSLTMGQGIKEVSDRYSNLLEQKLKAHGYNAEVYNMGVSGFDTCSEIIQFGKVKQLNFDIMVWEYYPNDVQPCEKSTGTQVIIRQARKISPVVNFLRKQSFFFDFLYWRLSPAYTRTYTDLRNADFAQYGNKTVLQNHLKDVATLSANMQASTTTHKVVVVFFPFLFLLNRGYPNVVHLIMNARFQKSGDTVIDLRSALMKKDKTGKSLMVNRFDSHPNELVNSIAADHLYDTILPIVASLSAQMK